MSPGTMAVASTERLLACFFRIVSISASPNETFPNVPSLSLCFFSDEFLWDARLMTDARPAAGPSDPESVANLPVSLLSSVRELAELRPRLLWPSSLLEERLSTAEYLSLLVSKLFTEWDTFSTECMSPD